jgi:hypothetical protein
VEGDWEVEREGDWGTEGEEGQEVVQVDWGLEEEGWGVGK